MSWVTLIWAILIGGCVVMALPHLLVGLWQGRGAHLFFVLAAVSVVGVAACELVVMQTDSVERFARVLQLAHVPIFFLFVALVGFVTLYFGTGQLWLGLTVCAVRFAALVMNFALPPSLNFREITALRPVEFLGEIVPVPVGVLSRWTYLGELTSLLLLGFVVDASVRLWRKGGAENRRRALSIGGSIALFILIAAGLRALTFRGIIEVPYLVIFPFGGILVAMAFELGSDLFRAGVVAQKLRVSEASLSESEARFHDAADAAPVLIWMAGPDKLCSFVNKAWLEFTGRALEAELGNGWVESIHPDDRDEAFRTYVAAFEAREPFTLQYRLKRHDGEFRRITDQGVPRYGPNGNFRGYVGACVDITELLEKDAALRESEERVALAAEAAQIGVWELNPATKELWVSEKWRDLFGFRPAEDVTYEDFRERVHSEDRARRDAMVEQAIANQGRYETEYRVVWPNGTMRWIAGQAHCLTDTEGADCRLLGVAVDVTKRKEAEDLFHLATEASPSGTLLVNEKGRILLVNAHIEELFGYKREELINQQIEMLVPDRFWNAHPGQLVRPLARPQAREVATGWELFARRKDGSTFPIEVGLNPIDTPQGLLVLASVVDISARKAAETEARHRREQIELLGRASLLGEMTASLAHELNQPLSAIMSNANAGMHFIKKGKVDAAQLHEIFQDVVADSHRAHEIVQNVRSAIKKGSALRGRINVNQMVESVAHMVQPDAMAHFCTVETALAKDLPAVEGDPGQIQQALINLVSNAFQAMHDTPPLRRKVRISTASNGNGTVSVGVRDYGHGIAETAHEHLFEQFFTTRREGLGMGLAIVRSIVEAHGGRIEAENVDGGGAHFHFHLPVIEEQVASAGNDGRRTAAPVCLLDDDPSVLKATGRLLCAAGFEVKTFSDPHAFLQYAHQHQPPVVVIDILMPVMDGLEVQTRLRSVAPSTRVFILTSKDDPVVSAKAMESGASAFFLKTVDDEEFLTRLGAVLKT